MELNWLERNLQRAISVECDVNAGVALKPPQAYNGLKLALQMQQQCADLLKQMDDVSHLITASCNLTHSFGLKYDLR